MNSDILIIKAQLHAMRSVYMGSLSKQGKDIAWLHKSLLWKFEKGVLPFSESIQLPSDESEKLERRHFQLQVLMDVAYLQGNLEQFDIYRCVPPGSVKIAECVFHESDGSEETMIPLIDKYF